MSQRGLSGRKLSSGQCCSLRSCEVTHNTVQIWRSDGQICRIEGTLQLQCDLMSTVLIAIADAIIAPMNQEELNRDVKTARSFGYPSSPIMAAPEIMQKRIPIPSNMRAMMYIATGRF